MTTEELLDLKVVILFDGTVRSRLDATERYRRADLVLRYSGKIIASDRHVLTVLKSRYGDRDFSPYLDLLETEFPSLRYVAPVFWLDKTDLSSMRLIWG